MNVVEREWKYGKYLAYENVEPELLEFTQHCRVLPAPSFFEKRLFFHLISRHEPGEHRFLPAGGFIVRGPSMEKRYFELDQVILHPQVIAHQKTLDKMKRKAEKEAAKREKKRNKIAKQVEKGTGKRGRKPLSEEEKARRQLVKTEATVRSGGKRGRPANPNKIPKEVKPKGTGKRGRPALTAEAKIAKEAAKLARTKISGGKRGRPKKIQVVEETYR
jgi:hypothetical protein